MKEKRFYLAFSIFAIGFLASGPCLAEKGYITDPTDTQIRSSASSQSKVIASLPSGTVVEVLKGNEWTRIRFTTPAGESRDGWVRTRSVGPRPPAETATRQLESENNALSQRLADAERQNLTFTDKEKQLTDKVRKLESDYEALKTGSADFLKFKEECDSTKDNLATAQQSIQSLIKENENLKLSHGIKWFAAGAAVLVCGVLMGWLSGRQFRKRRSKYYFDRS
jgi:SH3 domain protein